jgi:ABC-type amino acid transport substrate-binding protein
MFASVIIISTFTGAIASSVTAASLTAAVAGPDDLAHAKIAAVRDTAGVESLRDRGVSPRLYDTVGAALEAVAAGDVDAVVHDAPILKHAVAEDFPSDLRVLSARFNLRPYAIALPEESDDAEPLNQVLLEVVDSAEWRAAVERWVGDD